MSVLTGKKVLLMILDGWGIGDGGQADVVARAGANGRLAALNARYPHATLRTDGAFVGLPDGQMGNSEVGHINIGAGRVVYQDLVKINRAVEQDTLGDVPAVADAMARAAEDGRALHLMGLLSDGGVHSHNAHLYALLALAKKCGLKKVYVHAFMDGRDTDPKSGLGFVRELEAFTQNENIGELVSMVGRYWAMDRDKRWDRIKRTYDLLLNGDGEKVTSMSDALAASYAAGVTDEFVEPAVKAVDGKPVGRIAPDDVVIYLNYRNDRAKELTYALTQKPVPEAGMEPVALNFYTMTPYDATFDGLTVLFPKENVVNTIGEVVSKAGLKQLRIAETEKYAHVTFFLNGGRETPYDGEERILVASPKVATYDLQPEMSAPEVTDKLVDAIGTEAFDFICLNFANGDMVGHTGKMAAVEKAVKTVDACAGRVIDAALAHGYDVVQIADHGNADFVVNQDGSPNTAHSLNPVPILVVSDRVATVTDGVLADVAPTVLNLMGMTAPADMTGRSLVTLKA